MVVMRCVPIFLRYWAIDRFSLVCTNCLYHIYSGSSLLYKCFYTVSIKNVLFCTKNRDTPVVRLQSFKNRIDTAGNKSSAGTINLLTTLAHAVLTVEDCFTDFPSPPRNKHSDSVAPNVHVGGNIYVKLYTLYWHFEHIQPVLFLILVAIARKSLFC